MLSLLHNYEFFPKSFYLRYSEFINVQKLIEDKSCTEVHFVHILHNLR